MKKVNRVLLVDDKPVFRLGLRELVKNTQPNLVIVEMETFAAARALLRSNPDVVLIMLDIQLPDCGGFMGLFKLRTEFPKIPVVVFSASADSESVSRALTCGAAGYISKSASCEVMSRALRATLSEKSWEPVSIAAGENQVNPIAAVPPAQLRVLSGLKRGLRNRDIALELGLTEKTVKAYLSLLYRKLGVSSRTQALIMLQEVLVDTHVKPTR